MCECINSVGVLTQEKLTTEIRHWYKQLIEYSRKVRNVLLWGYIAPPLLLNNWEEGALKKESREGSAANGALTLKHEVKEWKRTEERRKD